MKILTIPDTHGKPWWNQVNPPDYDRVIFMGDYMDSFTYSGNECINNLMDIIAFATKHDNVDLLWGNHDLHYRHIFESYSQRLKSSGFNDSIKYMAHTLFIDNRHLFHAAVQIGNVLWSHAGVTKEMYAAILQDINTIDMFNVTDPKELNSKLGAALYILYESYKYDKLFNISKYRGGSDDFAGIFWADQIETSDDIGLHQVIGHTPVQNIVYKATSEHKHYYVDCWDTVLNCLVMEISDTITTTNLRLNK